MLALIIVFVIGIIVAYKHAPKREIGIGWGLLFCTFFSPAIGYGVIMGSQLLSLKANARKPTILSWIGAIILLAIGVFMLVRFIQISKMEPPIEMLKDSRRNQSITSIYLTVAFLGAGLYATRIPFLTGIPASKREYEKGLMKAKETSI